MIISFRLVIVIDDDMSSQQGTRENTLLEACQTLLINNQVFSEHYLVNQLEDLRVSTTIPTATQELFEDFQLISTD
jgi:hypothetical protein